MSGTAASTARREGAADPSVANARAADLCLQTRARQEAICLTRLGARAGLVAQLTGLEKAVANRLYRQLHGRPSPPGQLPFSDVWYLRQERRMAQATLVWQLSRRFAQSSATPARRLIDVYECYLWLVAEPLLDIMRVAFVPNLVAVQEWEEQTCGHCQQVYVTPRGGLGNTCWSCRLYLRHRCRHCGAALTVRPTGRHRELCSACQRSRHRPSFRNWP